MNRSSSVRHLLAGALSALALVATACVKDNNTGPGTAVRDASFIGYSTAEAKQTTCGNCHMSVQRTWIQTGHAKAWSDLQASGHASTSCNPCHSTNGSSNAAADTAGFTSVSTDAKKYYQDVQCEACHGPGTSHVAAPDVTQPLAYFAVIDTTVGAGCGTCHSGTHNPFKEEWQQGAHGAVNSGASNTTSNCRDCHEGKVALARFGGSNVYIASATTTYPQTCIVCHDPHGNAATSHELRYSITARDTTNLCIQCHKRRAYPDLTSSRGPHSPQGPTLLGISGWQPPAFVWDTVANRPAHADAGNPDLCAGCHVFRFAVANATGGTAYQSTGHTFYGLPCLKTDGTPDTTNTCAVTARSFKACASSGCHGSEASARSTFLSNDSTLQTLVRAIWVDGNGNGKVDTLPADSGMLASPKIPRTEFKTRSATVNNTLPYTVAEGAFFNNQLPTPDMSHGAHNPRYLKALLAATIRAINTQYGVAIPPTLAPVLRQIEQTSGSRR
jgi:predicted CXXCH cytochrome family protein